MVWIEGTEDDTEALITRFDAAPKPMCYQPAFLDSAWTEYLNIQGCVPDQVDPNDFVRWTYARAMAHRQPRYALMAENWGIKVKGADIAKVDSAESFNQVIAAAL